MAEKCFCHIVDKDGNEYEVKDAFARRELSVIEGRIDGKLEIFNEYSGGALAKMEEINTLTETNLKQITKTAEAASEAVRSYVDKNVYTEIQTQREQIMADIESQRSQAIDMFSTQVQYATGLIDEKVTGLMNKYGNVSSNIIDLIELFDYVGNLKIYGAVKDIYSSIKTRKLTFLITCKFGNETTTLTKRFSFDAYPAIHWDVSAQPANTMIQEFRIEDEYYWFYAEVRESAYDDNYHKYTITVTLNLKEGNSYYPKRCTIDKILTVRED